MHVSNRRSILARIALVEPASSPLAPVPEPRWGGAAGRALGEMNERMRPVTLAEQRCLPVVEALEPLLVGAGLQRGSVVSVGGPPGAGATSLALALVAGPSAAGSWVAAVGLPWLGLPAAAEAGVHLGRLALVPAPGPASWAGVVAALVDAFDVVLLCPERRARPNDARRLAARARERGAVLVLLGPPGGWREGPDVVLRVTRSRWEGLGDGHGHLRSREVRVEATGRRRAARPRTADLSLPAGDPAPTRRIQSAEGGPDAPRSGFERALRP